MRWSILFLYIVPLLGQSPPLAPSEPPVLRTDVGLVLAPVSITDKKGNFIDGLTVDDFQLTDNGRPQQIRLDTSDTVIAPISLVVLIQSAGISAPQLARIAQVGGMIKPIVAGERGRAAVITYDREVRVATDFTTETTAIRGAFERIPSLSIRTARMLDATAQGIEMLEKRPSDNRRIMLILGESRDRGSKAKLSDVAERAQRAGVAIYFATYSVQASTFVSSPSTAPPMPGGADYIAGINELVRLGKQNAANVLADSTGGRHMSFLTVDKLEDVITRTGAEIHSQYLLSFTPSSNKGGYHQLQVAVPKYPQAVIRVRPGYWAANADEHTTSK